ncbi:hypothetical protein TBR22_A12160 [Luteitalea sp. TBR-22]|uniref:hypothetical protein n=1 Tax=Luteitalea sp. TBR-22 TaxID=2802971 RepID=UPI001AF88DC3|nr:hypothetical protein [Luteitalea sp. TBR-22]BCS32012.1 hypothetical protein TBR22_A12160 [Luteitalea sp. TBR-22]
MRLPATDPTLARPDTLVLLAPAATLVPAAFEEVDVDAARHAALLTGVQRLRGATYLRDGAISEQQLTDGCHVQGADDASWHVVSVHADGRVMACARFRVHAADSAPESLGVWSSALARSAAWSGRLRVAIESDMTLARLRGLVYAEVGGWAVAEEWRCSTQAATTALSTYALAEALGGCIGITTATVRHCSARILRKLGGRALEADGTSLPSYFDPQYGCEMEILRFDSRTPGRKYDLHVARLARTLRTLPVVCATPGVRVAAGASRRLETLAALADGHVPCFVQGGLATA